MRLLIAKHQTSPWRLKHVYGRCGSMSGRVVLFLFLFFWGGVRADKGFFLPLFLPGESLFSALLTSPSLLLFIVSFSLSLSLSLSLWVSFMLGFLAKKNWVDVGERERFKRRLPKFMGRAGVGRVKKRNYRRVSHPPNLGQPKHSSCEQQARVSVISERVMTVRRDTKTLPFF